MADIKSLSKILRTVNSSSLWNPFEPKSKSKSKFEFGIGDLKNLSYLRWNDANSKHEWKQQSFSLFFFLFCPANSVCWFKTLGNGIFQQLWFNLIFITSCDNNFRLWISVRLNRWCNKDKQKYDVFDDSFNFFLFLGTFN